LCSSREDSSCWTGCDRIARSVERGKGVLLGFVLLQEQAFHRPLVQAQGAVAGDGRAVEEDGRRGIPVSCFGTGTRPALLAGQPPAGFFRSGADELARFERLIRKANTKGAVAQFDRDESLGWRLDAGHAEAGVAGVAGLP